jgi:hemin uptake protein HemP
VVYIPNLPKKETQYHLILRFNVNIVRLVGQDFKPSSQENTNDSQFSEIQMTQDLNSAGDKKQNETPRVPTFVTEELFQGEKEILIDHHGEQYRLSITKNDKLILTK